MLDKFNFKNLKIGQKYGMAVTAIILLFIVSIGIIFGYLQNASSKVKTLNYQSTLAMKIMEMESLFLSKDTNVSYYLDHPDDSVMKKFQDQHTNFNGLERTIAPKLQTKKQNQIYDQISAIEKKWTKNF